MSALRTAAQMALEALEQQHRDRTAYSIAKQAANATCAEFKNNTLSELIDSGYRCSEMGKRTVSAIEALRAALAADPQPVAWMWDETAPRSSVGVGGIDRKLMFCRPADEPWKKNITPLYTHPAPTAQPLTDEQIEHEWLGFYDPDAEPISLRDFELVARAVERAHVIGGTP